MKDSKRLLKAVAALVASVVLCLGVCLAWFSANRKVDANNANTAIRDINIKSFEVKAYRLTRASGAGNAVAYNVGTEAVSTSIKMSDYGGLVGNSSTALLLEFSYVFNEALGKNYAIYAHCDNTRGDVTGKTVGDALRLNCSLSSVINFYDIAETQTGAKPSAVTQSTQKSEEVIPDTKGSLITIKNAISDAGADGTQTVKFYCLIDYVESKVYTQYYKALSIEGTTLSTPMDFDNDISFYMQEA